MDAGGRTQSAFPERTDHRAAVYPDDPAHDLPEQFQRSGETGGAVLKGKLIFSGVRL